MWRKIVGVMLALVVGVILPFGTNAATLYWDRVTQYADNTAIPTSKVPTIVYRTYYSTSSFGPWTQFGTATDNVGTVIPTAGDPLPGGTMYYAGDASLDGMTSVMSTPWRYDRPFLTPLPEGGFRVVR